MNKNLIMPLIAFVVSAIIVGMFSYAYFIHRDEILTHKQGYAAFEKFTTLSNKKLSLVDSLTDINKSLFESGKRDTVDFEERQAFYDKIKSNEFELRAYVVQLFGLQKKNKSISHIQISH